jgi:phenylalanyl-tRNA synthetase alpha subunit
MQIQNSLDWSNVSNTLKLQLDTLPYNPDLHKMLKNIDSMVEKLSKLEVEARRTHKLEYTKQNVDAINKAIDHLEKLLLIAKLMA